MWLLCSVVMLSFSVTAFADAKSTTETNETEITTAESNLDETKLRDAEKVVYYAIKAEAAEIAAGRKTSTYLVIEPEGGVDEWKTTATGAALQQEIDDRCNKSINVILNCLMANCPYELYWYDKLVGCQYDFAYDATIMSNGEVIVKVNKLTLGMAVSSAYAGGAPYVTDPQKTSEAAKAAEYALEIVQENSGKSDYEKLVAYKNAICELVEYNENASICYNQGYGDPWQLIYVFDRDPTTNVVCEGYAKAFQYLCDLTTFSDETFACYTVEGVLEGGVGDGSHMWNVVTLNGNNYLVDVTNSAAGTVGADGELFLVGVDGDATEYSKAVNGLSSLSYKYGEESQSVYDESVLSLNAEDYDAS